MTDGVLFYIISLLLTTKSSYHLLELDFLPSVFAVIIYEVLLRKSPRNHLQSIDA